MRVAVVTLAVGQVFFDRWKFQCEAGWRAYCERHGYDLVVLDQPLDNYRRAQSRSPAWQKCLILGSPALASYDRVVWVDADIVINPASPPLPDVPIEKIGAVDEAAYPTPEFRQHIIELLINAVYGLPKRAKHIVQTGMMMLSPRHHRDLLEHVYHAYEDRGGEPMNYEMRPLSFEIQENGLQHWIDSRFNALVSLLAWQSELVLKRPWSWRDALAHNYFLHFAGRHDLMNLLTTVNRNAPCPCGSGKRYKHCHGRYD